MKVLENNEQFKEVIKHELVLVIAKGKTCGVCTVINAKLEHFLKDYQNLPSYQIYIEDVLEFSGQNLIFSIPTILLYSNSKELLRESRFINFDNIKRLLNSYHN